MTRVTGSLEKSVAALNKGIEGVSDEDLKASLVKELGRYKKRCSAAGNMPDQEENAEKTDRLLPHGGSRSPVFYGFSGQSTMFRIHTPFLIRIYPTAHLRKSMASHRANTAAT